MQVWGNVVESLVPATEDSFPFTLSFLLNKACRLTVVISGIIFLTFYPFNKVKKKKKKPMDLWTLFKKHSFLTPLGEKNAVSSMIFDCCETKLRFVIYCSVFSPISRFASLGKTRRVNLKVQGFIPFLYPPICLHYLEGIIEAQKYCQIQKTSKFTPSLC